MTQGGIAEIGGGRQKMRDDEDEDERRQEEKRRMRGGSCRYPTGGQVPFAEATPFEGENVSV